MKLIALTLLLIIIFSIGSYAFIMRGDNYVVNAIISSGAGNATSSTYNIYFAIMQQIIKSPLEKTDGTNYKLCLGIFCTGIFEVPHYVNVSGTVYYDTGNVVANSDAKLVVTVGNANYKSGIFRTDANGVFSTKVAVPETIMQKTTFKVNVYVTGRIEAVYSCTFNKESGICN
jgi:hypothetical protein